MPAGPYYWRYHAHYRDRAATEPLICGTLITKEDKFPTDFEACLSTLLGVEVKLIQAAQISHDDYRRVVRNELYDYIGKKYFDDLTAGRYDTPAKSTIEASTQEACSDNQHGV